MTAVEWLLDQIQQKLYIRDNVIEQAKEIEKQQIMKSNRDGVDMVLEGKPFLTAEQYYNETYKPSA
jgi:hypothetical protein